MARTPDRRHAPPPRTPPRSTPTPPTRRPAPPKHKPASPRPATNHGLPAGALTVELGGEWCRACSVTASVTVDIPAIDVPVRRHRRLVHLDGHELGAHRRLPHASAARGAAMSRRRCAGDRGSVTVWTLGMVLVVMFLGAISFDLWSGFATRREYAGAADQAAQAGANALDEALFRSTGERKLDPQRAEDARRRQPRRAGPRRRHRSRHRCHRRPSDRRADGHRRRRTPAHLRGRRPPRRTCPRRRTTTRGDAMNLRSTLLTAAARPRRRRMQRRRRRRIDDIHDRAPRRRIERRPARHRRRPRRPRRRRQRRRPTDRRRDLRPAIDIDRTIHDGRRPTSTGGWSSRRSANAARISTPRPDVSRIPEVCADGQPVRRSAQRPDR